ncbi:MAG: hypothetical protein ACMUIM_07170, partial [bacterium]
MSNRKTLFFSVMVLLLFLGLAALIIYYSGNVSREIHPEWLVEKERKLANKLKGVGLLRASAGSFERYLEMADLPPKERSRIAYTIGQLYMEVQDYEKALPWLYEAELTDPDTALATKLNALIITCLERLGRYQAAEYALKARTALDSNKLSEESQGENIVARIGQDVITLNQINQAFDALPPWIKQEISEPAKKKEFARQYIAEEILYKKGLKLGFERDPANLKKIEQFKRQLIITQVREKELEGKLSIDDADVKNYFLAHQKQYQDPNQERPPVFEE